MEPYLVTEADANYILLTRMFGAFPLSWAILCLLFLRVSDITAKKAVAISMPVWLGIMAILFVIGIVQGNLTNITWGLFAVNTLLAVGFISSALRKDP